MVWGWLELEVDHFFETLLGIYHLSLCHFHSQKNIITFILISGLLVGLPVIKINENCLVLASFLPQILKWLFFAFVIKTRFLQQRMQILQPYFPLFSCKLRMIDILICKSVRENRCWFFPPLFLGDPVLRFPCCSFLPQTPVLPFELLFILKTQLEYLFCFVFHGAHTSWVRVTTLDSSHFNTGLVYDPQPINYLSLVDPYIILIAFV